MAYKVFTNGSVLNASEMNEYLMNQSVITFTNSTARGSAITTPVEGMITYLEDTQTYESWDGAAWVAFGGGGAGTGNAIINGAFEINQRGLNSTGIATASYGFDRWATEFGGGTINYSAQTFSPGEAPVAGYEGTNFARVSNTTQTETSNSYRLIQTIEDVRTFAGQTVTASFFAKALSGTPSIALNLQQVFGTGGSAAVDILGQKVALTTSWARYSLTFEIPSILGKTIGTNNRLVFRFWTSAGSAFNDRTDSLGLQAATIDIWGVQLEAGSEATLFRRNANSIQGELAACQRYYQRFTGGANNAISGGGVASSTTVGVMPVRLAPMRVSPTSIDNSGMQVYKYTNDVGYGTGTFALVVPTQTCALVIYTHPSGVFTSNDGLLLRSGPSGGFIGFSAEL